MSAIAFPLRTNQRGAAVGELHAALDELIAGDAFMISDWEARAELLRALTADRDRSRFGAATRRLLAAYQTDGALETVRLVDEAMAQAPKASPESGTQAPGKSTPGRLASGRAVLLREGVTGPDDMPAQERTPPPARHARSDRRTEASPLLHFGPVWMSLLDESPTQECAGPSW